MKQKKRDRTWFERKVGELGEAIQRLPQERQLELFKEMEQEDGGAVKSASLKKNENERK